MKELINQIADHLYCLNLVSRTDKKERSQEVFDEHNLDVEFFPAISGETYETTDTMLANYKAQNQGMINIFQDAIDKGYSKIGIFEDDIAFTDDAEQVLTESLERTTEAITYIDDLTAPIYLLDDNGEPTEEIAGYHKKQHIEMVAHLPDAWDFFTLGCLNTKYRPYNVGGRVYKLRHANLGHCWFFKDTTYQAMIDLLDKKEMPYDECISSVFFGFDNYRAYGILKKGIAYQRPGYSDNLKADVDNSRVS